MSLMETDQSSFVDRPIEEAKISVLQAAIHVFKGSIGTGILGLPYAVKNCGILVGTISLTLLGILTIYCMNLLVICSKYLSAKYDLPFCDYGDVAELSLKPYGRKVSHLSRILTDIFIVFTQFGFLCVYVVFISATIMNHFKIEKNRYIVIILFTALLCITLTSNIRIIGVFSSIASVVQTVCLISIFIYLTIQYNGSENLKLIGDYRTLPLFFGTAIFAYEGIAVILPLENVMVEPKKFFAVVDISMTFVCVLYILSGFLGYAAYGDKVKGSITLNLPSNTLFTIVQFGYAISIFLSYPIQFYVPMKILEKYLNYDSKDIRKYVLFIVIRISIVLFTCIRYYLLFIMQLGVIAILIPSLEHLLSLSGSLAASTISLTFPAFLHLMCFKNEPKFSKFHFFLDGSIIIIGLCGSILGTYTATVALLNN